MAEIKESRLIIRLLDNVTGPSRRVMKSLNHLKHAGDRMRAATIAPAGFNTSALRNIALVGGGYIGLTQAMNGTFGAARNLEAQLREIAIKGDLSDQAMKRFGQRLTNLSPLSNQTTDDLTKAADAMISFGLDTNRTIDSMPAIARAATASGAAIDDLAKSAATLMQSFKVDPKQISDVLDMMVTGGNLGALELKDMAQTFPALVAGAKSLGMEGSRSVADLVAALEIARRGAADSATAGNNLQNVLQKALSPRTMKNFKGLGVDIRKELELAVKKGASPLERFIELTAKVTKNGRADLMGQLFGDKQVLEAMRPLIADFKDYLEIRKQVENSTGATQRAYIRRMENANEKLKAFGIRMSNLGRSIGESMLDPLGRAAERLTGILDTLGDRATILDRLKAAFDGLAHGAGFKDATAAITQFGQAVERFIFGSTDEDAGAALGRIFKRFDEWGQSVRRFTDAIRDNPVGRLVGDMAGRGFQLMLAASAISILAGSLWKLARAAAFLSGLTTAAAIVKGLVRATAGIAGAGTAIAATAGGRAAARAIPAGAAAATGAGAAVAGKVAGSGATAAGDALVASGRATTAASGLEKAAFSMTRTTGLLARTAGKVFGWPTIVGEVVARALVQKGLSDERFKNPNQVPAIMRQAEDRREGREPVAVPAAQEAKPFSFGQLWKDLTQPIKPTVDDRAVQDFVKKSEETGKAAREALSITAKPLVDTESLDAAMAKVRAFASDLMGLGGSVHGSVSTEKAASASAGIGHRAAGGPIQRGLTYEINERGRETITMGTNGYVTRAGYGGDDDRPAAAAASAVVRERDVNVNVGPVHIHGANADQVLAKLGTTLHRALSRSRQISLDGRPVTT